ncbi:hypothetical protein FB446DRAFT_705701, partial [Lentinula raphanica]
MPPKRDSKKGPKTGPLFEPQKADQNPEMGSAANTLSVDNPSPSEMAYSGQLNREKEVSSDDFNTLFGGQPPPRPRSPTEPGQIRETPVEEDDSQLSSNGNTVRSSPLAAQAARKQSLAAMSESEPVIASNVSDTHGKSPIRTGVNFPIDVDGTTSFVTPDKKKQTLLRLIESQEVEAQDVLDKALKEVRFQQVESINNRFRVLREWIEQNPLGEEDTNAVISDRTKLESKTQDNLERSSQMGGELNMNSSAKPSTRHVYPNGKTFDEMVNDPRFVDISGSTRNIGNPLSWEDRVVGQMMRSHSMKDGKSSSLWHDQGISFDKEGRPHHREGYDGGNKPQPKTQMQVASGDHYPDDSDSDDSSDDSFDGYRPQDESRRSRTPWLESDSSESEVPHPDDYGYEDEKISRS